LHGEKRTHARLLAKKLIPIPVLSTSTIAAPCARRTVSTVVGTAALYGRVPEVLEAFHLVPEVPNPTRNPHDVR